MARQERQFQKRQGMTPPEDGWRFDPQAQNFTEAFKPFEGGVPNNPDNLRSFAQSGIGGSYVRRNPYGDAEQEVAPEEPVVVKRQLKRPDSGPPRDIDIRQDERKGPGFGFGEASPLNRPGPFSAGGPGRITSESDPTAIRPRPGKGGSYAAPAYTPRSRQKGTDFGTGRRNAPPPP